MDGTTLNFNTLEEFSDVRRTTKCYNGRKLVNAEKFEKVLRALSRLPQLLKGRKNPEKFDFRSSINTFKGNKV